MVGETNAQCGKDVSKLLLVWFKVGLYHDPAIDYHSQFVRP